jgi:hypothetical protein
MQTWTSIGAVAAVVVAAIATPASAGGSHRDCRWSDWQGYHRHIGANDRAISCDEQVYHRRAARRDHRRRLHVEQPYYGGYDTYYYGSAPSCVRDWHCERTGLFGLDKYCYWRQVCD